MPTRPVAAYPALPRALPARTPCQASRPGPAAAAPFPDRSLA
jgi:hypothetical protein